MSESQQHAQWAQGRAFEEHRRALAELEKRIDGLAENTAAREQIDADIAQTKAESKKKADADVARVKAQELARIKADLRALGASDEEADELAPQVRANRLQRQALGDARPDEIPPEYRPL